MKKILICGATGFIGRNLTKHFSSLGNYEVHATWHIKKPFEIKNVIWNQGDLRNSEDVERLTKGMDIIVQAAATTSGSKDIVSKPYIHVTDNAVMNSLLLRASFELKVKHFIFFSCSIIYPSSEKNFSEADFDTSDKLHSKYFGAGWTKIYIEKMCDFFSKFGQTKHTVIRHTNIYGPHDKYDLEHSHVFGASMTKIMNADDRIVVWGNGEEKRDLLYVKDLVRFVEIAIENQKNKHEVFNCGLGQAISIKDLVKTMIHLSSKKLKIEHNLGQPSIKSRHCLDCSKAKNRLGWEPKITLEEGIQKTLNWYRRNILISEQPE